MKQSAPGRSGAGAAPSARCLRSGAAGFAAALVLATLASPVAATDVVEVNEGETTVLSITLPYGGMTAVRYTLGTEDGSAKAGVDFEVWGEHQHEYAVFPVFMRDARVAVRAYPDEDADDEHFSLVLSDLQTRKRGKWKARPRSWATRYLPASKKVRVTIIDTIGRVGRTHEDEEHGPQ